MIVSGRVCLNFPDIADTSLAKHVSDDQVL
jgi:hypothetical protein